ncbi:cytochrome c oxidase subunit 2 [Bacillus oleivorans]|uniref:Cytochrome c oxidase subunit 2 n=1 Tax=Bacillus oleivorans TaxID=1448271 RepID=A0A285D0V0_9BACI|nr:cytochrome c oxidase subunit II [Bacillus oleivorans]SNX73305.1 cytochrome c oxidase subunit 2 [Bacillus oleivorans]
MKKRLHKWRFIPVLAIVSLLLAGCGEPYLSALQPAGTVAQSQLELMILSTTIMVLVILVVTVIFLTVVIKFRRKKGDNEIPKQVEGNHKLEIIWTTIPILLLLVLAVPTVAATFNLADVSGMEPDEEGNREGLVVNVRANLYWWEFEYPDYEVITSQDLVVPTGQKVYFNLKSSDVKHSFWIPAVGGKLDTNTEVVNKFWLEFDPEAADEVADNIFYGKCAELCGPSHAFMDFKVKALSQDEFNSWITAMQNYEAPDLTNNELAQRGSELFSEANCISCHAITPQDERPEAARTAPNLAAFGDRVRIAGILPHEEEYLKAWLKDPEELKPGNLMTDTYPDLTDEQIDALTEYLFSLKVQE